MTLYSPGFCSNKFVIGGAIKLEYIMVKIMDGWLDNRGERFRPGRNFVRYDLYMDFDTAMWLIDQIGEDFTLKPTTNFGRLMR